MLKGLLIIAVVILVVAASFINHKHAPKEARKFLEQEGYSSIEVGEIRFFGAFDFCSKGVSRVNFKAHKGLKPVEGYVCVESLFRHSVHLD